MRALVLVAAIAALVLVAGAGHLGYDASWALLWGEQLAGGSTPAFTAPLAPTPHPLATLFGALVSPLGPDAASDALLIAVALSSGWVVLATWRLGSAVAGPVAGVVAALVVATRPALLGSAWRGSIDIPALALVLAAAADLARPEPRWTRALVLIGVAGLLRPEAWLLALAVAAYPEKGSDPYLGLALRKCAVAVAAPVLWALWDLSLTGDPLFSFTGTRELADELDRPRTATLSPILAGPYLRVVLGTTVALAGLLGLAALARRRPRAAVVPIGLVVVGLGTFVLLGAGGLPLLARYLLVPAAALAVCAGAVIGAWREDRLVAAAAGVLLLAAIPGTVRDVREGRADGAVRRTTERELRGLAASVEFDRARRACGSVRVASFRMVPELVRAADLPVAAVRTERGALLVLPASGRAAEALQAPSDTAPPLLALPPGARRLPAPGRDWALAATGC